MVTTDSFPGNTIRTLLFENSLTRSVPAVSTARPHGWLKRAAVPNPSAEPGVEPDAGKA
jgi:hypothetical protein